MNAYFLYSFKPTNKIGFYHYADKMVMPVFCKYIQKIKK